MTYDEAEARLKELLESIERHELPFEHLLEALKEARGLIEYCHEKIYETDKEVKKILEKENEESQSE